METIIIIAVIVFIILMVINSPEEKEPDHKYHAEFGDPSEYLSSWNHGFCITGDKALTKLQSCQNCVVFGPTGSGKSSIVIINSAQSLARGKSSVIFNDVSGELWDRTSSFLADKGYTLLRLNFADASTSESYNPLLECRSIADIQKMALLLIRNSVGESKGDPFWEQASIMLISVFSRYLVFHAEPQYRTLQNVLRLIERFAIDGKTVDRLFAKTCDEDLLTTYKSTIVIPDKTLQSIIATTRNALNLFNDPEVCKTTATNSIDFQSLRQKPVAIYVSNPLKDLIYFRPLSALFFQSMFNYVLSRIPGKQERFVYFVIDEFATMRFPALSTTVSNIRKYKAGMLICMQDEMSLIAQYGQAEAHQIKTNCSTQVFLKGQPSHTCKELSQVFGRYSYEDEKGIQRQRELMAPEEIRMCEDALVLINNAPPLRCKTVPYYEQFFSPLRNNRSYMLVEKNVTNPPLILFDK